MENRKVFVTISQGKKEIVAITLNVKIKPQNYGDPPLIGQQKAKTKVLVISILEVILLCCF